MPRFSGREREAAIGRIEGESFDVAVIGGGITGAGIALDAAVRGLKVALLEKRDFASGTSGRSTKLIHGGLRYLEQFDFALVREALLERAILARIAPHLAEPFPFLIPIYKARRRNYDLPLKMRAGLVLYDVLAGRYGFGRHRKLSREEALEMAPQLDPEGLKGAFLYFDAVTDDSRLVIEIVKAAAERGATIVNYAGVTGFLRNLAGRVEGVEVRDHIGGRELCVRAGSVINATGIWMNEVLKLDGGGRGESPVRIRPAKGIHLTVAAEKLKVDAAWLIPSLTGHRFYFVVPWEGRVNIGTTDTDYSGNMDAPRAETGEVTEILGAINAYFPAAQLDASDVISSWAGLRPLISDPKAKDTSTVSRKEELVESSDGVISISGGKLTTYRLMAERTVDLAARRLSESRGVSASACRTGDVPVSGGLKSRDELARLARDLAREDNLPPSTASHLLHSYGSNYQALVELMRDDERLRRPLVEGLPHVAAEIVYAARDEMALTIADALARRTRIAMLAGRKSLDCSRTVGEFMAGELGWDPDEIERQVNAFRIEFAAEYEFS